MSSSATLEAYLSVRHGFWGRFRCFPGRPFGAGEESSSSGDDEQGDRSHGARRAHARPSRQTVIASWAVRVTGGLGKYRWRPSGPKTTRALSASTPGTGGPRWKGHRGVNRDTWPVAHPPVVLWMPSVAVWSSRRKATPGTVSAETSLWRRLEPSCAHHPASAATVASRQAGSSVPGTKMSSSQPAASVSSTTRRSRWGVDTSTDAASARATSAPKTSK